MRSTHQNLTGLLAIAIIFIATATAVAEFPASIQTVLDNTQPLQHPRRGRLPLFVLPISHALSGSSNEDAEAALRELDRRGIGYTVDWNPGDFDASLAEGLRIARLQSQLGLLVGVNANTCLYSFSDGSPETLHVDSNGQTFAEASFGTPVGCPFALEHRIPVIKERVERFLRAYRDAGVTIDFVFADWEIDGPIEWNDAWAGCQRCSRCRDRIRNIDDFRAFQRQLRQVRSELQRVTLGDNVRAYFPEALVGNYGVTPHGGIRHWYDYFERETPGAPFVADRRAKYREWAHEFDATGYTFAMPVVYTWYPTYGWYDFADTDYRWFYNMLLVGSDAGEFTPAETPIITFVHWHTTAPPENPDPSVRQFSREKYQDLLWHLLLRGHDAFFLWCQQDELAEEVRLVHEVYAAALEHHGFLERGTPITFDVPQQQTDVVSGLRIGDQVLVRHTPIGSDSPAPLQLTLADGSDISVPATADNQIVTVRPRERRSGLLTVNDQPAIPIGCYELPADEAALKEMAEAGINLVHCNNRADLDRAQAAGLQGWISVAVQQGDTPDLRQRVASVADHPALAVWEGPDEIVWTFTAYSTLAKSVGITRDDWNNQTEKAVRYSEEQAATIIPNMRAGIAAIRELDPQKRPFWMNEAADSDLKFVRQYEDSCDVIGCDYYAVRSSGTDLQSVGRLVDRWDTLGRGQPVWMVLQGFSWHTAHPQRTRLYPTFAESRFMAYDSLVHGARAVLYWGTNMIDEPKFRQSLYALTSELSALQPFLVAEPHDGVRATVVDDLFDPPSTKGVRAQLLRHGTDYLLILVNEDPHRHLGIDVTGLDMLDGRELKQLYGGETATVQQHGFTTRLQGFEVKLFATNAARYESPRIDGRDYDGE